MLFILFSSLKDWVKVNALTLTWFPCCLKNNMLDRFWLTYLAVKDVICIVDISGIWISILLKLLFLKGTTKSQGRTSLLYFLNRDIVRWRFVVWEFLWIIIILIWWFYFHKLIVSRIIPLSWWICFWVNVFFYFIKIIDLDLEKNIYG